MRTLTKEERQYLLKKYMNSGLDFDDSVNKVNKFHDYLKDMRDRLREKKISDEDIETKFREEFEKLVMKLE
jgi:hypothetical protein